MVVTKKTPERYKAVFLEIFFIRISPDWTLIRRNSSLCLKETVPEIKNYMYLKIFKI